jgi:tRNA (cytidine/uridine-2'-O-)-methyltransferase
LCACTGADLILVGDTGFRLNNKHLKRAGMDYLDCVEPKHFADFPDVLAAYPGWTYSFLSSKATQVYTQAPYQAQHLLVFGSEETGLPARVLEKYSDFCYRIPMLPDRRSLNLATSVGIVLYEALRQLEAWPTSPSV